MIKLKEDRLVDDTISEVKRIMKEEWKVMCFSLENPINEAINDPLLQVENFYFNHGFAHPRMWAQYAESHKGVCLIFNQIKLDHNIQQELSNRCRIFQGTVQYDKIHSGIVIPPLPRNLIEDINKYGPTDAARKYLYDNYKWYFLRKHPDWESEVEYRWLIHSEEITPEFVSITGAIEAVLVGADFPIVYEPSLRTLCRDLHVPAGRINWEDGIPIVDLDSIYKL